MSKLHGTAMADAAGMASESRREEAKSKGELEGGGATVESSASPHRFR
jgi:hypothetical protein